MIAAGKMTLETEITISENAWRKGGGVSGGVTVQVSGVGVFGRSLVALGGSGGPAAAGGEVGADELHDVG